MITIYGRATSSNVQKALWCAGELGIDFIHESEYGGPHGKLDQPDYLALNPNGLVPTLVHDDFVLWESNTIVRYLGLAFGAGSLSPSDPRDRANAERWMDWNQTSLDEVTFPAFYELVRKTPDERDQSVIDRAVSASAPKFAILDAALERNPYVAGSELTIGDIVFGPGIHRWLNLPVKRSSIPNVEAWYARMKERPAFAKYVAIPLS